MELSSRTTQPLRFVAALLLALPLRMLSATDACADPAVRHAHDVGRSVFAGAGALVGTEGPITVVDGASDGRWFVIAQARVDTDRNGHLEYGFDCLGHSGGDELRPWFVSGRGPGEPLSGYWGRDPSARYLAYSQGGRLWLRDTVAGLAWELCESDVLRRDASYTSQILTDLARFDATGERLLYARRGHGRVMLVVRDLRDARERTYDPGGGQIHDAWFDPTGHAVRVTVVPYDSNGDGVVQRPTEWNPHFPTWVVYTNLFTRDLPAWFVDRVVSRVVWLDRGVTREVDGLVDVRGEHAIVRRDDGALGEVDADGTYTERVPAACKGTLVDIEAPARGEELAVRCDAGANGQGPTVARFSLNGRVKVRDAHWPWDWLPPVRDAARPSYLPAGYGFVPTEVRTYELPGGPFRIALCARGGRYCR